MSADHQASALISTMQALHRRGWCDGTGGNFSVVVDREPLQLLMAPSGVDKGTVTRGDLIVVNGEGKVMKGNGRASAETLMHLRIVEQCGAGAVLHTHSINATWLSRRFLDQGSLVLEGWEMLKGLQGINTHATSIELPIINNDQNLETLSETAGQRLEQAPHGLLVSGHGLYAWGADLQQARRHTEIHEFLLELAWRQTLVTNRL
ncbi:methylthioribulose 1-phosphate dehydratase [Synechococcus sp. NOUM97013]|uniref:methylthioribulose 1-phosphate dehydratase n=1 Tax=Synechococcus sp. NOUM97013 TaxID=1442555 RepID=UPI00164805DF|nr:methylthioribulose 1-phosphate dehydratase [Synechococcus sp. NOUM97013]QNI72656.1 methylthioribulose-1-phosphate dehydratase [Synechococcus sp. NOUM97013]